MSNPVRKADNKSVKIKYTVRVKKIGCLILVLCITIIENVVPYIIGVQHIFAS